MSDLISRRDAIEGVRELFSMGDCYCDELSIVGMLNGLPTAEPEFKDMDEWCTDCKEYDQEKYCCPRWNKVIRKTVEEMQLSGKIAKVINRCYNGTVLGIVGLADRSYGLCGNCQGEVVERYSYCPHCGARLEWE